MDEDCGAQLAAYKVAIEALPVLARAVFLTSRDSRKPYREIAAFLGLEIEEIKKIMTYANAHIAQLVHDMPALDDGIMFRPTTEILITERRLLSCYEKYLHRKRALSFENWLRQIGPTAKPRLIEWLGW